MTLTCCRELSPVENSTGSSWKLGIPRKAWDGFSSSWLENMIESFWTALLAVTAEALFRLSDTVLVPTIPTTLSMRTLEQLRKYYQKSSLKSASVLGFFSMVDRRKTLHRSLCDSATKKPFKFLNTCIPFSSTVERMGLHRNPVCFYAASSKPSRAFRELWEEIRGIRNG